MSSGGLPPEDILVAEKTPSFPMFCDFEMMITSISIFGSVINPNING